MIQAVLIYLNKSSMEMVGWCFNAVDTYRQTWVCFEIHFAFVEGLQRTTPDRLGAQSSTYCTRTLCVPPTTVLFLWLMNEFFFAVDGVYLNATIGSLLVKTLCNATDDDWLASFPSLTSTAVRKHLPQDVK